MTMRMRSLLVGATALFVAAAQPLAQAKEEAMQAAMQRVAPALARLTDERLLGDVWNRPGLSKRARSVVTLAALIARDQTIEMPFYLNLALDNGVKPQEISEIITHLAFYTGWANAISAVLAARDVFASRNI